MTVKTPSYAWHGTLEKRKKTAVVVIHHRGGTGDAASIHAQHLANGWTGIGYHYYIRSDGQVFAGRPDDTVGAHAAGHNSDSIGVCFEGNFEITSPTKAQIASGKALLSGIFSRYGVLSVKRHGDLCATACPGKHLDVAAILPEKNAPSADPAQTSADATVCHLLSDGVITAENVKNWELFLSGASPLVPDYVRTVFDRYSRALHK